MQQASPLETVVFSIAGTEVQIRTFFIVESVHIYRMGGTTLAPSGDYLEDSERTSVCRSGGCEDIHPACHLPY